MELFSGTHGPARSSHYWTPRLSNGDICKSKYSTCEAYSMVTVSTRMTSTTGDNVVWDTVYRTHPGDYGESCAFRKKFGQVKRALFFTGRRMSARFLWFFFGVFYSSSKLQLIIHCTSSIITHSKLWVNCGPTHAEELEYTQLSICNKPMCQ